MKKMNLFLICLAIPIIFPATLLWVGVLVLLLAVTVLWLELYPSKEWAEICEPKS